MVDHERDKRQAKVQRAISSAHLTRQISELETKVKELEGPSRQSPRALAGDGINNTSKQQDRPAYSHHFPPLGHQGPLPPPPPPPFPLHHLGGGGLGHGHGPFGPPGGRLGEFDDPPLGPPEHGRFGPIGPPPPGHGHHHHHHHHGHPHDHLPPPPPPFHHGPPPPFKPFDAISNSLEEGVDDLTKERASEKHGNNGKQSWRVVVVDVSGLMWAPKTVRKLVGQGCEVVIPLDALRTLDLLKKGSNPTAIAARSAARYIEHGTRNFKLGTDVGYKKGRGLRLQRDDESSPISDALGGGHLPKWINSVFSCTTFFVQVTNSFMQDETEIEDEEPKPILYISHPPLSAEVPVDMESEENDGRDYAERAEGYAISQEAERFELCLEVMRDEDADLELEGRGPRVKRGGRDRGERGERGGRERGGRGGRERGHGRGGRGGRHGGGGRHSGNEDQPQVKILLRRPDEVNSDQGSPLPPPPLVPKPLRPDTISPVLSTPELVPARPERVHYPTPPRTRDQANGDRPERGGRGGRGRRHESGSESGQPSRRGRNKPPRGGSFTLLQRPGPPLVTRLDEIPQGINRTAPVMTAGEGRRVVLLQRPK